MRGNNIAQPKVFPSGTEVLQRDREQSPTESGRTNYLLMVTYVGPRCAREQYCTAKDLSLGNRGPTTRDRVGSYEPSPDGDLCRTSLREGKQSPTESGRTNYLLMVIFVGPRCAREQYRTAKGLSLGNRGPTARDRVGAYEPSPDGDLCRTSLREGTILHSQRPLPREPRSYSAKQSRVVRTIT